MLMHSVATVASQPHVVEAGVLRVIRNAVIAVVVIVFLVGVVLGFLLGKLYGRNTRGD